MQIQQKVDAAILQTFHEIIQRIQFLWIQIREAAFRIAGKHTVIVMNPHGVVTVTGEHGGKTLRSRPV